MSLDLSMLVRRVADLSARLDLMPSLRWGTVVTASPLTVRLDGDADAVGGLESLTGTLALGARVLVVRWNRRGVVLGTSGQRGQVIIQSGSTADVAPLKVEALAEMTVTFQRPFVSAPTVIASPTNSRYTLEVDAVTSTTATLRVKNTSQYDASTPSHVNWVAVGVA